MPIKCQYILYSMKKNEEVFVTMDPKDQDLTLLRFVPFGRPSFGVCQKFESNPQSAGKFGTGGFR